MVVVKEGTRPPWVGLGVAVWVEIASDKKIMGLI
jgi:hypothetical protein